MPMESKNAQAELAGRLWVDTFRFTSCPYILFKVEGKWGLIDQNGQVIIPPRYDSMGGFDGEFMQVKLEDKWGFIDKSGCEAIPPTYDVVERFSEGLAQVSRADR